MQNLNTLFNLVKQAAPVTADPYTQESTSTLHYNNPLGLNSIEELFKKYNNPHGPGLWQPKQPNVWDELLKNKNPLGPGFWQPKQPGNQSNPWEGIELPSWWSSEDKKNPWERNKDQDKYYDEFWKWYNKDGLWTYRPGSDPMWEDETWRKHKKEFIDYYNNQNQPATSQPAAQPAPTPAPVPAPAAQPASQPTPQQSSTHIVGPVIGKTTYNPADIINK